MMPDWEVLTTSGADWLASLAWGNKDSLIDFWERKLENFKKKLKREISCIDLLLVPGSPGPAVSTVVPTGRARLGLRLGQDLDRLH